MQCNTTIHFNPCNTSDSSGGHTDAGRSGEGRVVEQIRTAIYHHYHYIIIIIHANQEQASLCTYSGTQIQGGGGLVGICAVVNK